VPSRLTILRAAVVEGRYLITDHADAGLETDDLTILDVEFAIAHGKIRKKETDDLRGTRWEIVGPAEDGREMGVVVRMLQEDNVLIVTVYERK
jgi:hypothetical protein